MNQPASAYFMEERRDPTEAHTLSVLVQNEPGVLARVIGLFSGRGYNIESLTVSETESQKHLSRITIVTTGTPMVIEQIKHQLDRMIPVYRVVDMTLSGRSIERELAMVKVRGQGDRRYHRKFCVRDHRQLHQDQPVHRPDASAWPGRGVAHRRRRHRARA
jgi:acetolactate synthase I/III small subunit